MIKNNIEADVEVKCIENGTTQAQLAETIGTTGRYVNRFLYFFQNRISKIPITGKTAVIKIRW